MIFPVKRLMIENDGYRRDISLKTIYINSVNIVSISDYSGATEFLLREESELRDKDFSLIKLSNTPDDIIILGSAVQIYSHIREHHRGKKILND
tara:strand:+ start:506 stop:787 length:282 start_codon:yes stop_codon:yes gene_type:complete